MSSVHLRELIGPELTSLRGFRRDLHAHPELGYQEHRTAQQVCKELDRLGIKYKAGLAGGTGVVAYLPATSDRGQAAVGLRADMDALPIHEQTALPYASTKPGLMHACGHDGHTAVLVGAARVLAKVTHRPNPVVFVFQPAEEGGGGANKLCQEGLTEGKLIGPPIGRMFGLHGWPEFNVGTVGTRPGPLLASTDELRVTIVGVQAHGAYPHYSRDPVLAASQCIVALQSVVSRNVGPLDSAVVTIGQIQGGTATNIIPESVSFIGTVRALKPTIRQTVRQRVSELIEHTAMALGCRAKVDWHDGYPVTNNDPALTQRFMQVARETFGEARVVEVANPTMGGEDFSFYSQKVPAVFFCLGLKPEHQAKYPTLHQPDFDFNDDALPIGIEMFCRLALAE